MLLRAWESDLSSTASVLPRLLVRQLEHQYTQASLSFHNLKGKDRRQVEHIAAAAAETGTELFLANIERKIVKDDGGDEEVIDSSLTFTYLATLDGQMVTNSHSLNENNLIDGERLDDKEPDEEHSGFTGNEGCTATYWYRDSVGLSSFSLRLYVLMPNDRSLPLFRVPQCSILPLRALIGTVRGYDGCES